MNTTDKINFYKGNDPKKLIEQFGSPLYVYNESILRQRCTDMKSLTTYPNFTVNFSAKANSNLAFLQIVNDMGLSVDAMSPGEMFVELKAGFTPDRIFYISNNVTKEEMQYAIDHNVTISVDSLSQLEQYGQLNPNSNVAIRFNPGVGAGHHENVVTGGKKTKFGVNVCDVDKVHELTKQYNLTVIGINQHIGSLFMDTDSYIEGAKMALEVAKHFDTLQFVDFGGGFGIPYRKQENEQPFDLQELSSKLTPFLHDFAKEYGKQLTFKIEPGRYISAECGVLLGTVTATKTNDVIDYIGCDIGFNVLARPVMYDSHHDIEIYTDNTDKKPFTVVGNICETGDILAKDYILPIPTVGDTIGLMDAGAYGFVMSSNYNNRLRPAEVLIREDGSVTLIRKRDTLEQLIENSIML